MLISTGYPSPFKGDKIFAVDVSCLQERGENHIKRFVDRTHYEIVILDNKLYAGSMDSGVSILDLNALKLYVGTYERRFTGDSWRWEGNAGKNLHV